MLLKINKLGLAVLILMAQSVLANAQSTEVLCDKKFYKNASEEGVAAAVSEPNAVFLRCPGGETPLHRAVSAQNLFAIRAIVKAGGDVDARTEIGNTPLHFVVLSLEPRPELVDLLVSLGADIHQTGSDNQTPLEMALSWQEVDIAEALRRNGAKY
ncbi:ankyrin repeat domain-containing protein [Marinobacter segnicrescens]|uniref:ankyrin repeat domain-containing protein n=1 Tax=Marinobacter segnicrescens TaxID=430453 RepID=UPI003A92AE7D